MYSLHLNGEYYGSGDLAYMMELIQDWVITHSLYGQSEANFKIVDESNKKKTLTEKVISHRLGKVVPK